MNSSGAAELIQILSNADIFLLIFVRILGMVVITPVIGGRQIPVITRIGLSLIIASLVYSSGNVTDITYNDSIIGYGILIAKEFFVGFIIGFVIYFIINIMYLAGHFTDQQIGFSMVSVYDPITQAQVPITGNLYYFAICVLFIVSNGHHMVIKALFYSYKAIPIGMARILENGELLTVIMQLAIQFFSLGFTIAMPIIGIILVMDLVLGILVKTVPKINVFVVGMPLKVFVGLIAIWIVIPVFISAYNIIFGLMSDSVLNIIKVMMP